MPQTLIEELRRVAHKNSGKQPDKLRRRELHKKAVSSVLAPSLAKIHEYLSEFKQYLSTLDPETNVDLSLREFGKLSGLQQTHYRLLSGSDPLTSLVLAAELQGDNPVRLGFQYEGDASVLLSDLKLEGLTIISHTVRLAGTPEQTVLMEIEAKIPVKMEFRINTAHDTVDLEVTNFEELGERRHTFAAKDINDEMLNELGKYILRRENKLLNGSGAWDYRNRLRERLGAAAGDDRNGIAETAEVVVTRLRDMLVRKEGAANLQISFRDIEIALSDKEFPYQLGRKNLVGQVIKSTHASRQHATIIHENDKFLLCDHSNKRTVKTSFIMP